MLVCERTRRATLEPGRRSTMWTGHAGLLCFPLEVAPGIYGSIEVSGKLKHALRACCGVKIRLKGEIRGTRRRDVFESGVGSLTEARRVVRELLGNEIPSLAYIQMLDEQPTGQCQSLVSIFRHLTAVML